MKKTIGFIGSGNMGGAIIGGIVKSGLVQAENIIASGIFKEPLAKLEAEFGISTTPDNIVLVKKSDIIFLAIKPNIYARVIDQIKNDIKPSAIIITIAAGQTLEKLQLQFGKAVKIVRTMPNTPALVGEGMSALCPNEFVDDDEIAYVSKIFDSFGKSEIIPEYLMDAVVGVSGSSPAYTYIFIEAMADAAVREGMPRDQAYKFAAQAVLGAAKMVLETGMHPGQLKDNVCSPGGATIEAVCELENRGMRAAVMSAMDVCIKKSKEMSKPD